MKKLTTTSYAILSLLAIRPWSGYELAREMRRNVGHFWPRAERGVYDEPKSLVAHGLARGRADHVGGRRRTLYTITPEGRAALAHWLSTPVSEPVQLESETLLRVAFAENGTLEDVLAALAGMRLHLAGQLDTSGRIARQYADDEGRYPDRIHLVALVLRFLVDQYRAADEWAAWAAEQLTGWGDVTADAAHREQVAATLEDLAAQIRETIAAVPDGPG